MDSMGLRDVSVDYQVSAEAVQLFRETGHVTIRDLIAPADLAVYAEAIRGEVARQSRMIPPLAERDDYGKAFLQIMNLWETNARCREFVFQEVFARVAGELMGVDRVRLYHDQALFKEPGGGQTFWHQDQYYWPLDTPHTVTMWLPFQDTPEEMGALRFADGSHRLGRIVDIKISTESDRQVREALEKHACPMVCEPLNLGDASFHLGWTCHAAPPNRTDRMREVMTIIYYGDGARMLKAFDNVHHHRDAERWLPGCAPGDPAVSPNNPLLYAKTV